MKPETIKVFASGAVRRIAIAGLEEAVAGLRIVPLDEGDRLEPGLLEVPLRSIRPRAQ